jgi:GTP-binding protein EngB required for normal cell division
MSTEIESVTVSSVSGRLRDYDALKLRLASAIQRALRLVDQQAERECHASLRALLTKLAEDRFVLAVIGQFSRGKSSPMNALMGIDRLPVGILPLTSVVTKVSYGNPERVLIEYPNSSLKGEIPVDKLAEYVTENGNPGNRRQIAAAEVQLPSEFLRRGIYFVDTPGIGSAIRANTETTKQFLPHADAVVLVMAFDSPLGGEEIRFIQDVKEHVRKVFLAVNKLDLVDEQERDRVLAFIRASLRDEIGLQDPRLFAVSASEGLRAKLAGSTEALSASGIAALETALVQFLTEEKVSEFLGRACERALCAIAEMNPPVVPREKPDEWNRVTRTLEQVRKELSEGTTASRVSARGKLQPAPEADLMRAVRQPCRVCNKVADAMFKYMAKFQYRVIMDESEQRALAAKGGLCPLHTWQYAEIASPQGICAAYPDILKAMSDKLIRLAESGRVDEWGDLTRRLLPGPDQCCACQQQRAMERAELEQIEREIVHANEASPDRLPVLCLQHLSGLLRTAHESEWASRLIGFEAAILERLAENMRRYVLKHDALRRGSESEDERVAYRRGLSHLAGDKRLRAPWRVERLI